MTGPGSSGRRSSLRATVVNCTPDHNKGASAISWGIVNRLVTSDAVGRVTLVAKETIRHESDFRHTIERFGNDVRLVASPLTARQHSRGEYSLRNAFPMLVPTAGLSLPSYRRMLMRREEAVAAIATSDVVFSRGGPFFSAFGRHHVGVRLNWPFLFARQEGIPYAIVGEGVGPFENRWARSFYRWLFEGAALVAVRDELSRERLRAIGICDCQIQTMLDNAFWIEPKRTSRVEEIVETLRLTHGGFLAVTIREWRDTESAYAPELVKTIDSLVPSVFDHAVLIPNAYRPDKPQNPDRAVTRRLHERLKGNPGVHLVDIDLTPEELACLYGMSAVTLGTRLHSVILALVGGAPVVSVSYLPKANGVMAALDLDEFVLGIDDFRHERAIELVKRAAHAQAHVPELLGRLRDQSDRQLNRFLMKVGPGDGQR